MERGADPGRRSLLLGAAVVGTGALLGGCTGKQTRTPVRRTVTTGPTPSPRDQDDVRLVIAAIADEERLLSFCSSLARRHREARDLVLPLLGRQRAHVEGLRAILTDEDPAPVKARPQVPATVRGALPALVQRVERARQARYRDCLSAQSGPLAAQFASISASHAASADLLSLDRPGR